MRRFDASNASCIVLTGKEGILSPMGHELKIRVATFGLAVEEEPPSVEATFDARSLRVVCAVRDGKDDTGALSTSDRESVDTRTADDVLDVRRHPEIRFRSRAVTASDGGKTLKIEGTLSLHGREKPVAVTARREGANWIAEARLHQPDFDIKPYRALFGAIRVHPDVTVRLEVPWPA